MMLTLVHTCGMLTIINIPHMWTITNTNATMRFLTPRELGALVRDTRLSAGVTQAGLGAQIGASRYWVAEFERGKAGAELGLTLKALRALKLVLTVEHEEEVSRRERENGRAMGEAGQQLGQPSVDLSSILSRSVDAADPRRLSEPFRIYDWRATPTTPAPRPSSPDVAGPPRSRRRKRTR